jgi:hypothetical protein
MVNLPTSISTGPGRSIGALMRKYGAQAS